MLIGFTGKAGVGKTTIAKMLRDKRGFEIQTYAKPLKEALSVMSGLPIEYFTDIELKETMTEFGVTPRQMMQKGGTDFVREMINKDFWVIRMEAQLKLLQGVDVVIDDIRFDGEANLVRKIGGVVVHLMRNFDAPTTQTAHKSEQGVTIEDGDIIIGSGDQPEIWTYENTWSEVYEQAYSDRPWS